MKQKIITVTIILMLIPIISYAKVIAPISSVTSTLQKYKQDKLFLIDTRSKEAYDKIRIPGSLNFPLHAIKTKPFLKTKPVVLINNGFSTALLKQECSNLNQKGFKASVLTGGLTTWRHQNGPLEGDLIEANTFSLVSPQDLFTEKTSGDIIVIDASKKPDQGIKKQFPEAHNLSSLCDNYPSNLCASVVNQIKTRPDSSILILNQDGKEYETIENLFSKANIGPLFFLEGGLNSYETYLEHLSLSQKPREERLKTIGNCNTCGKKDSENENKLNEKEQ